MPFVGETQTPAFALKDEYEYIVYPTYGSLLNVHIPFDLRTM